jgi:hypothetical protein
VVEWALAYNSSLHALSKADSLLPGLKPVKPFDNEGESIKRSDLRDIYRIFVEERTKDGVLSIQTEEDAQELGLILNIEQPESFDILLDVQQKAYRKALREEFASGRLATSESKATVLNDLCYHLNFSLENAKEINGSIYKQRFEQLVEKRNLTEADEVELEKLRILLCINDEYAREVKKAFCGQFYSQAIQEAFNMGIEHFCFDDRETVKKRKLDLRLENDMALEILDSESRKAFMKYVSMSRTKSNRLDAAKEIKKMVLFSNTVVSSLLEDAVQEPNCKDSKDINHRTEEFNKSSNRSNKNTEHEVNNTIHETNYLKKQVSNLQPKNQSEIMSNQSESISPIEEAIQTQILHSRETLHH